VKKELKTHDNSYGASGLRPIGDEVAAEMIGPVAVDNREPVYQKMTDLGNGLWDLHTKIIVKKHLDEPVPIEEGDTEEMKQKTSYRFPDTDQDKPTLPETKKSLICDYSSSDEDEAD
jgi:hypothetical protein